MHYLGIDIGKRSHVASMLDESGKTVFKAFSFSNTTEGADSLIAKLDSCCISSEEITVGMEATGHYWLSLYSYLADKTFFIHVVNPIQTDGWRKGIEIRKRKTDIIDSILIADLIRYGNFLETSLLDENTMTLRNLARFRNYQIDSISDLKRKVICVLDQVFPEYDTVFSNIFGKTSKEILLNFSTPADFEDISSEQLENFLQEVTFKDFAMKKIDSISKLAKNSFGVTFAKQSFVLQLKQLIQQINFIEQQVADIDDEIATLLEKMNTFITTIPGVGNTIAATILGEIGDISRFSSPAKLVAYAGLDAVVHQSGEYNAPSHRMSKRGSPYLRTALFRAALIAAFNDPVFSAYYQKKRSQGKHHLVAIGAVARKLCNIIHAILKNNVAYDVNLNK